MLLVATSRAKKTETRDSKGKQRQGRGWIRNRCSCTLDSHSEVQAVAGIVIVLATEFGGATEGFILEGELAGRRH